MHPSTPALDLTRAALRETYAGKKWIVAQEVLQGGTSIVAALRALGVEEIFALGAVNGTGPLPNCPHLLVELDPAEKVARSQTAGEMMAGIQAAEARLDDLPASARAALDEFDPHGEAQVIRTLFSTDHPVGGRKVWGGRREAWRAWEDKLRVDALWDHLGVPRAPAQVVPATAEALRTAHAALDTGRGTVWAADNRAGWHGGAQGVRHVFSAETAEAAIGWLAGRADAARVMPWLSGVPCSIHGIRFGEHNLALRPCEMVIFRKVVSSQLTYAQAATFWDPPEADRQAMREMVRKVGDHLHAIEGFRGTFTIDGVLTAEGFRPTELNPRFGAAIGILSRGLPDLPLYLLHCAVIEGLELPVAALEAELLAAADGSRAGASMQICQGVFRTPTRAYLHADGEGYLLNTVEEGAQFTVNLGPSNGGSMVMLGPTKGVLPVGPPSAPRIVAAWRAIDAAWQLGLGNLEAAALY